MAGVLSPNLPNNTIGSWTQIDVGDTLPTRVRQGGTVMPSAKIVAIGGCDILDFTDNLCAQQDAHVISVSDDKDLSPPNCAAARVGPVLAPFPEQRLQDLPLPAQLRSEHCRPILGHVAIECDPGELSVPGGLRNGRSALVHASSRRGTSAHLLGVIRRCCTGAMS